MSQIKVIKRQQKDKLDLIENLKRMPIIEVACTKTGISRATYYRWKESDPTFSQMADKAQDEGESLIKDVAVSKIIKGINEDNLTAAMYWLNHRDPRFSNKVEISTISKPQEALSAEQQEVVSRALAMTGLIEDENRKENT
jgi:hypothetical protein